MSINSPSALINFRVREAILGVLYDPVQRDLNKRLKSIAEQNCRLHGLSHLSFSYKGSVFNAERTLPPRYTDRLDKSLHNLMTEYQHDRDQINDYERPIVIGGINHLLNSIHSFEDVLLVLPATLYSAIEYLKTNFPSSQKRLTQEELEKLKETLKPAITLMKERMALNLLY